MRAVQMHSILGSILCLSSAVNAIQLDVTDPASIRSATKTIVGDLLTYYTGNRPGGIPGIFGQPYYWWEGAAVWDGLINYWALTGDSSHNALVEQALLFQTGPDNNYMPPNQSFALGNDDQGFWALAALSAAERNLPQSSSQVKWLDLAVAVFNDQVARWDTSTCAGGLRWQIYAFNAGYTYKNSDSQGTFFQLAARLALLTGNQTYADWAEKVWDWTSSVGLISDQYAVYDGTDDTNNCTSIDHLQWTLDAGLFLYGSGVMYNFTKGSSQWQTRTDGLLQATDVFFPNSTLSEVACESTSNCDTDQQAFKALLARWMGATTVVAPFTTSYVTSKIRSSAKDAAASCSKGVNGTACGEKWSTGSYDGITGVGEQLSALEVIQANLLWNGAAASSNGTTSGGGSQPSATSSANATVSSTSTPATVSSTGTPMIVSSTSTPTTISSTDTPTTVSSTSTPTTTPYTGTGSHVAWTGYGGLLAGLLVAYLA